MNSFEKEIIKIDNLIPKNRELTFYSTKSGDRTLTKAQKRKIKEEQGFKCAHCHKKKPARYLEIHHKKEISEHKSSLGVDLPYFSLGKKIKPAYDKKNNLEAVCIDCHDKTKKGRKKKSMLY